MTEIKTVYNLHNLDTRELNFLFQQIANRLDALEGLRGTPQFYADINAGGNKIQNAQDATASGEVLTYPATITDFTHSNHDHENTAGGGQLSHNDALTGLTEGDPHTQYLLLTGRAGGQVTISGTGSGDDLTLQTTSHVTKGSYIFSEMTTAGYLKNDVNGVVTGGNPVTVVLDVEIFTDTDTLDANNDVAIANKGSAMTLNLPAATGSAKVFYIKNIGAGVATVEAAGAETIDGAANQTLNQWDAVTIIDYDAGVWVIL